MLICQAGKNKHEDICDSMRMFAREVMPEFHDDEPRQQAWREQLAFLQNSVGAIAGPFDSFLALRGIKTLALRLERSCTSALDLAKWLEQQPKVEKVYYPGLASHPQHELARRQMQGFGGIISINLKTDLAGARRFLERCEVFTLAESLGGVESLIEHPALMTHATIPAAQRAILGIGDGLIRLSVGVEHLEDLRAEKSRLQNIAYNRGPNAKPTETQEAAAIAANVIKDTLEKHIDAALPGEGKAFAQRATDESVLLRMKAIADKNVAKPRAATYPWSTAMSVARHPLTAAVRTVRYGFQTADEALAALARAARSGKRPPSEMVDQALAAGVKPESADAIMSRIPDDAVPVSVDEGATVPTPMERMSDIVPRAGMGEDLAAGQAKRASLPDDVAQLDKTQRIRR